MTQAFTRTGPNHASRALSRKVWEKIASGRGTGGSGLFLPTGFLRLCRGSHEPETLSRGHRPAACVAPLPSETGEASAVISLLAPAVPAHSLDRWLGAGLRAWMTVAGHYIHVHSDLRASRRLVELSLVRRQWPRTGGDEALHDCQERYADKWLEPCWHAAMTALLCMVNSPGPRPYTMKVSSARAFKGSAGPLRFSVRASACPWVTRLPAPVASFRYGDVMSGVSRPVLAPILAKNGRIIR